MQFFLQKLLAWTAVLFLTASGALAEWSTLPALPDEHGFAGPFAGVSNGALIVAGGANFPDGYPWDGGKKMWHDSIFVLEKPDGQWTKSATKLPRPLAYGISLSINLPERQSAFFIGGDDAAGSYADVYEVTFKDGKITLAELPKLPTPAAMASGALIGTTIYVAGGTTGDGSAASTFYRLDLSSEKPVWETLPWPDGAPGRILSVAGAIGGKFYLFGGADLGSDNWDKRTYLNDAYSFDPKSSRWTRLADMPEQMTAGPTPAISGGQSHLLLIGGASRGFVDAQRALRPDTDGNGVDHPGFPKAIYAYHTITNTWVKSDLPVPAGSLLPVTTCTLRWDGKTIIPTGEIKPGIRSPQMLTFTLPPAKSAFGVINWIIVVVYLLGMVLVGYWFSKRNKSTDDYFRGGQRIPWWVAGLSIFATMLSAITFMAIPARAYATDVSWYIGQLPVLIVVPVVIIFYLPYFRKLNITSAYEFLEKRFNLPCRLFASLSFILFHIGRVAIVLYLPALALSQVSPVDVVTCIVIIGILCIIYTVMGGIEAVVWTDAIQAIVLVGGALLCLILIFFRIDGGVMAVWDTSVADAKLFDSLNGGFDIKDGTTSAIVLFVAFLFNAIISYTSGQDVVQRYVTTPTEKDAARSLKVNIWLSIFGSMIFFGLGLALYAFYKAHPASLDPGMDRTDSILPFFVLQQLPVGVAGLIIAAIFAAAQSTVSSSLNSVSTAYVTDFHARVFFPENSDAKNLFAARIVVLVIGILGIIVACIMAKSNMRSAFEIFNSLIGLTAGALGGLFALGIFNKRANGRGAFIGALIAFATVVTLFVKKVPVSGLLYAFIGFMICLIAGSLLSVLFSSDKAKEI